VEGVIVCFPNAQLNCGEGQLVRRDPERRWCSVRPGPDGKLGGDDDIEVAASCAERPTVSSGVRGATDSGG